MFPWVFVLSSPLLLINTVCGSIFPSHVNTMDKIEILTTGNAVDFGDITGDSGEVFHPDAVSNGHGGL